MAASARRRRLAASWVAVHRHVSSPPSHTPAMVAAARDSTLMSSPVLCSDVPCVTSGTEATAAHLRLRMVTMADLRSSLGKCEFSAVLTAVSRRLLCACASLGKVERFTVGRHLAIRVPVAAALPRDAIIIGGRGLSRPLSGAPFKAESDPTLLFCSPSPLASLAENHPHRV